MLLLLDAMVCRSRRVEACEESKRIELSYEVIARMTTAGVIAEGTCRGQRSGYERSRDHTESTYSVQKQASWLTIRCEHELRRRTSFRQQRCSLGCDCCPWCLPNLVCLHLSSHAWGLMLPTIGSKRTQQNRPGPGPREPCLETGDEGR